MLNKVLYDRIMNLPDDIKYKIYKEYLEPEIKRKQILCILHRCNTCVYNKNSQKLLLKMITNALNNEYICNYLCKTCKDFDTTYDNYLKNTLGYRLITDKYEKFVVNWLVSLFH